MNFKKTILVVFLSIITLVVIGCSNTAETTNVLSQTTELTTLPYGEEYIITGNQYNGEPMNDLYRVYYEIYVGAFSDSNEDGIGDIRGIINRLDYLNDGDLQSGKSLGVTGLWLMPIMPSPTYHKYDTTNYKAIDEAFGTMEDFEELMIETDQRGIDVIIDLVLNHTSSQHPWFLGALEAYENEEFDYPYLDYYTLVTEDEKVQGRRYYPFAGDLFYEGNFWSEMPELNLDSELVREEIKDIIAFWLNKGVDGFRLDAVKYPYYNDHDKNIDFWEWFMNEVQTVKSDAYVVGEMWDSNNLIIDYYQAMNHFDFGMAERNGMVSMTINGYETVNGFVSYLDNYQTLVQTVNSQAILQPFLSNHDMNRVAGYMTVDDYRMHMAANLYMLTHGTPFIYYGEEIGARGSRGTENTDANRRLIFYWGDGDTVQNPPGATWTLDMQTNGSLMDQIGDPNSLYTHYKTLIMIRQANPEIARGDYTPLDFDGYTSFGGFLSTYEDTTVGIFHNIGNAEVVIDLSQYTNAQFSIIRGAVGMSNATLDGQILTIGPKTSVVLK